MCVVAVSRWNVTSETSENINKKALDKLHSPYEISEDKSSTIIFESKSVWVLMFNLYSFKIQKLSMHDDMFKCNQCKMQIFWNF